MHACSLQRASCISPSAHIMQQMLQAGLSSEHWQSISNLLWSGKKAIGLTGMQGVWVSRHEVLPVLAATGGTGRRSGIC